MDEIHDSLQGSDCLVLVTAHSVYKELKLETIKSLMRTPIIVDGRNVFNKELCTENGFIYKGIGK
jgi:UDPglucose 6-dehydrogenase